MANRRSSAYGAHNVMLPVLGSLFLLAGCGSEKAPEGQVVANVDGQEVTRRELTGELRASGGQAGQDIKAVGAQLVDRIVARKLLAEQAKKEGLDKTPAYIDVQRRSTEELLSNALIERWASQIPAPSPSDQQNFIAANPHMFGERRLLLIDQIQTRAAGIELKALEPLKTNEEVAAYLAAQKHPYQRVQRSLDTMSLNKQVLDQISALPPGEPFAVSENGVILSNVVIGARPAPVPEQQQAKVAESVIKRQEIQKRVQSEIASLRTAAKITYQKGFEPPAPKAAPAGPK